MLQSVKLTVYTGKKTRFKSKHDITSSSSVRAIYNSLVIYKKLFVFLKRFFQLLDLSCRISKFDLLWNGLNLFEIQLPWILPEASLNANFVEVVGKNQLKPKTFCNQLTPGIVITMSLKYTLFFIRTSKFCLRLAALNFFHFWDWNVLNLFLFLRLILAMPRRKMSDWVQ